MFGTILSALHVVKCGGAQPLGDLENMGKAWPIKVSSYQATFELRVTLAQGHFRALVIWRCWGDISWCLHKQEETCALVVILQSFIKK